MHKVRTSPQVDAYLATLPPEIKHRLRLAMRALAKGRGDVRALEDELAGFHRLRVGRHRVVFCYRDDQWIDCIFAEERKLVYELFSALLRD
jgi:mRNA interferase RelE/StbE